MACVSEDDDRKGGESANGAGPFKYSNSATRVDSVALDIAGYNKDDEVGDGEKCNYGRVFEGVETAKEGQRNDDEPESISLYGRNEIWYIYMNAVIQNCLSTRKLISSALGAKPTTTPGIKSPMMIR